jgi:hypothetical protein
VLVGLRDVQLPGGWLSLQCLAVGRRVGMRYGADGLSFHQIYARTRPSRRTPSGGNALPTSPARGANRDSSETRSTTMLRRCTRRSRSRIGYRRRRRKRRPRRWRSRWRNTSPRTYRRRRPSDGP